MSKTAQAMELIRGMDQDELRELSKAIRVEYDRLQRREVDAFIPGDRVQFFASSIGRTLKGTVTRINRKTVGVQPDDDFRAWRVSPAYLTRI